VTGPEPDLVDIGEALRALDEVNPLRLVGKVTEVTGLVLRATIPGVRVGELVFVDLAGGQRVQAEVVGFRGDEVVLLPLGDTAGIGPDAVVSPTGRPLALRVGPGLLGRVLDGLGEPIDGRGAPSGECEEWPVDRPAPDPLTRRRVDRPLSFGIRPVDAFVTVGEGQRVGLFAGAGAGKSTLLGQIARASDAESIAPPSRNSKSLRSKGYVAELSRTFSFRSASVTFVLTSGSSPRMTS